MIASATWNSIFTDIATALTTLGQQNMIPYPSIVTYTAKSINFNSANTDTGVALTNFPTWATRLQINTMVLSNPTGTLTTASAGLFTSTSAGGATLAANQTLTVNNTLDATNNNSQVLALTNSANTSYVLASLPHTPTIYVRVGTAQGSAATADVTLLIRLLP